MRRNLDQLKKRVEALEQQKQKRKMAIVRDKGTPECQARIAALEAEGYKVLVITREKRQV